MTTGQLTAFICYRHPEAAVRWITGVLGFEVVRSFGEGGQLFHVELRRGDAVLLCSTTTAATTCPPPRATASVRVCTSWSTTPRSPSFTSARSPPEHGSRRSRDHGVGQLPVELLDPEGRQWSIGTYLPGQPDSW